MSDDATTIYNETQGSPMVAIHCGCARHKQYNNKIITVHLLVEFNLLAVIGTAHFTLCAGNINVWI